MQVECVFNDMVNKLKWYVYGTQIVFINQSVVYTKL